MCQEYRHFLSRDFDTRMKHFAARLLPIKYESGKSERVREERERRERVCMTEQMREIFCCSCGRSFRRFTVDQAHAVILKWWQHLNTELQRAQSRPSSFAGMQYLCLLCYCFVFVVVVIMVLCLGRIHHVKFRRTRWETSRSCATSGRGEAQRGKSFCAWTTTTTTKIDSSRTTATTRTTTAIAKKWRKRLSNRVSLSLETKVGEREEKEERVLTADVTCYHSQEHQVNEPVAGKLLPQPKEQRSKSIPSPALLPLLSLRLSLSLVHSSSHLCSSQVTLSAKRRREQLEQTAKQQQQQHQQHTTPQQLSPLEQLLHDFHQFATNFIMYDVIRNGLSEKVTLKRERERERTREESFFSYVLF